MKVDSTLILTVHVKLPLLICSIVPLVTLANTAHAQPETQPEFDREGFTIGLNIGLGMTRISPEASEGDTKPGIAGLNFDLGAYITPQLAVLVRFAGTQFSVDIGTESEQFSNGFFGVAGQYWVTDNIAAEGGIGIASFGPSPNPFADTADIDPEYGFALSGRGTYRLLNGWQGAVEVTPCFYDFGTVIGSSLLVGYQWD